ncbi:MAG: hypothetical protein JWP66_1521 [Naasia sp.]|nr:hypothetical protein [Naasia sp.]
MAISSRNDRAGMLELSNAPAGPTLAANSRHGPATYR